MAVLGGGAVSYERGTPVQIRQLWGGKEPVLTKLVRLNQTETELGISEVFAWAGACINTSKSTE